MGEELRRHQDRAMANLESMPGGFTALQRMYRNIQEPMNQFGSNPFQTVSRNEDSNVPSSTEENSTPLPNPWSRSSNSNTNSNTTRASERNNIGVSDLIGLG